MVNGFHRLGVYVLGLLVGVQFVTFAVLQALKVDPGETLKTALAGTLGAFLAMLRPAERQT